jgi:hypothetical protein
METYSSAERSEAYIDWSKYNNGAIIIVTGYRPATYPVPRDMSGSWTLELQQKIEYRDGDPCHIIWVK